MEAQPSRVDGKVWQVKIKYKNSSEFRNNKAPTRTTNRAARSVARLAKEGELGLMQELAAASHMAAHLEGTGEDDPGPPLVTAVREKSLPTLTPAGLGRGVNALFQLNPDPYATFCGSMKILGIETFFCAVKRPKFLARIYPLKKHTEK